MTAHIACLRHLLLSFGLLGAISAVALNSDHLTPGISANARRPQHHAETRPATRPAHAALLPRARHLVRRQLHHPAPWTTAKQRAEVGTKRTVAVESKARFSIPSVSLASSAHRAKFAQVPVAPVPPVVYAPTVAPLATAAPVYAPTAAPVYDPNAPTAAPVYAPTAAPVYDPNAPTAAPVATVAPVLAPTVAPVGVPVATVAPAGNSSATKASTDSPPYLQGPLKILVYGLVFALLYLLVFVARLPAERRPTAVDETLMRWIEFQEEDDPAGSMNCVLVRVKSATGLPADKLGVFISVECSAFKKSLNIGDTDDVDNGEWNTCFVGPLMDQDQSRAVTMDAAKPEVKFTVKYTPEGGQPTEFAQAIVKAGSASASSSAASAGGGGLARGSWCIQDVKLQSSGSGALGMLKRVGGGSLGTLSVEVKCMNVNPAGKAVLKSNYFVIALRNEFKKPYSACARTLAAALFGMLTLTSLPTIGDMFNGCFYLSCHGLSTAFSLFCMAIPHWCKLFQIPLPTWVTYMSIDSLKVAAAALMSAGSSGVWMCLWWGRGTPCTDHFWMLEILLCVDSLLFSTAYAKGEGGGLMAWFT